MLQALLRQICGDVSRIYSLSGFVDGYLVYVSREDLDLEIALQSQLAQAFRKNDGDRIGFFSSRAAWYPNPDSALFLPIFKNIRNYCFFKQFESFGIPE